MIIIRKIIFISFGSLILMSSKCTQTKEIIQNVSELEIINVYTQKQVPGEQNQKAYIEFGFEVKGLTNNLLLDSVFCEVGQSIEIKVDGKKRIKLQIKDPSTDTLKYDKAIIYYTQKGAKHQFMLNNIIKKEEIFLP